MVGQPADVLLFGDPQPVRGRLMATDAQQEELLVADFDTALGRLPHARLRTSDVMAVRVELAGSGRGEAMGEPEPGAAGS